MSEKCLLIPRDLGRSNRISDVHKVFTEVAEPHILYCLMYNYYEPGTTMYLGLVVSLADSRTGALAKLVPGQAPIFAKFFLHFYRFMLNYFIQVISNYKNDKNTPLNLY